MLTARPVVVPHARQCSHPAGRPAPLRRLAVDRADAVVELLVSSCREQGGAPCCILPAANSFGGPQDLGLFRLLSLQSLTEHTLAGALAAVDGHVANTCTACPSNPAATCPSPLAYCHEFSAFLERSLEMARERPDLGPAPAVLLLQIVSRMGYGLDDGLRQPFRHFYLHLQVTLEAAVELHTEQITPQVVLAIFESWARMGASPMHCPPFGTALRQHIKHGRFSPPELSRLLAAMASLRVAQPRYRPCAYDVADICGLLMASDLRELAAPHLASVAASLSAFPWPVYQCVLPLLEGTAQEGVRRQAVGEMAPPAGAALVASALASARALNPRLGAELEGKLAGWKAQAHVATGNQILAFADTPATATSAGGDPSAPTGLPIPAFP